MVHLPSQVPTSYDLVSTCQRLHLAAFSAQFLCGHRRGRFGTQAVEGAWTSKNQHLGWTFAMDKSMRTYHDTTWGYEDRADEIRHGLIAGGCFNRSPTRSISTQLISADWDAGDPNVHG